MKWILLITSVLFSIAVTSGKQIEVLSSKLILQYNWPEPKKNLERYPYTKSCSHFYVNKPDGSQSLKKCPENELFDFRTLRCRPKVLAKCWNDLLKKDHSKKIKRRFSCPFPWGLYPNVEDCSTFYDCLSGKSYLRKCPSSTLFDKAERTCVNETEALCADHSDIVEADYKCLNKWGYFTYSKDCSKFYECLRKVPSLRSCKKNMLFDNLKRNCMPVSGVDCGERFNPYEKDKESIEHVSTGEREITTESIRTGRILEITKLTSTEEEVTTRRVSNRGEGMTTKITLTEGIQETTKLTPASEDVTTVHVSNGRDGMTIKRTPTGGVQEVTKLTPTSEHVTTRRVSNEEDGMLIKSTPTGGVQEATKLPPSKEEITTGRVSSGGMTTRHIPKGGPQETIKLILTREDIIGRIPVEGEQDKFKHISTEYIKTSGKRLTPEIIPAGNEQKAVDDRNSKKEERI